MKTVIFITTQFEGWHRWKDAPEECKYLREWHRHMFHVRLEKEVSHGNRDIEFIQFKHRVDEHISLFFAGHEFEMSCEQIAAVLFVEFEACRVEVSEDGENGAVVSV